MAFARHRHRILETVASFLAILAVLGCAARLLPASWQRLPWVPVVVAASPWSAVLAAVALVLALVSRRWFVAAVCCLCIVAQAWWQMPYYRNTAPLDDGATPSVPQDGTAGNTIRVMTANVYRGQADAQRIVDLVGSEHVGILALQETTDAFLGDLSAAGLEQWLPYTVGTTGSSGFGNALWSAWPLADPQDAEFDSIASAMPAGTVTLDDGTLDVRFVSVHTTSPTPATWQAWSESVAQLATLTGTTDVDYVLMGDFNATTDHAVFRAMLGTGYQDATMAAGRGLVFTWPADRRLVPAGAALDHIVVGNQVRVGNVQAVTIDGSDHRALLATLQFPQEAR